tara:strand:- start:504 stop:1799 length:1296 start_codon:yes stop_codon:yes gene_type:complete
VDVIVKLLAEFFLPLSIIFSLSPLNAANDGNGILQNVEEGNIKTSFTNNDDYADLASFGEAIGDKRFVVLDEATHGEGNVFALKARLVKYLYEKKEFDVFLIESALYDVSRVWMNDKAPIANQAPGNIFYMYANSAEMQPLFNYIDTKRTSNRPLQFAGFDNRHSGSLSNSALLPNLKAFLKKTDSNLPSSQVWAQFTAITADLLKGKPSPASDAEQKQYFATASKIASFLSAATQLQTNNHFKSNAFWYRIIKSITRMAEVAWGLQTVPDHDLEMIQNIEWLMKEVYPGKKAIVWGHYVHVAPNGNPDHSTVAMPGPVRNVGTELKKIWPDDVYYTHFGSGTGAFTNFITLETENITAPSTSSLEALLNKKSITSAFIDTSNLDLKKATAEGTTMWTYDYAAQAPLADWKNHWDGMFFLNPAVPVDYIGR